jgi:hypothetical protein
MQGLGGRRQEAGEVTLLIRYDAEVQVNSYQLIDGTIGALTEVKTGRLLRTPQEAVESLVVQLNELARGAMTFSVRETREWLKGHGIALWEELIPAELQRQFWDRQDQIKRMFILSEEAPFPWEVLYPFREGGPEHGFLAEQFPVARLIPGDAPVSELCLSRAEFVCPEGSPDSAVEETKLIQGHLAAQRVAVANPRQTLSELLDLLTDGGFHLLHFSCHNSFQNQMADAATVQMGSRPFQPNFLRPYQGRWRRTSPLVFMNACRSAGRAPQYTRLDGWARSFLRAGAGAFLGTHWEVRDDSACVFAEEFYRCLLRGQDLGNAVLSGRKAIQEVSGDPTWLAYALYGDPAARTTVGAAR